MYNKQSGLPAITVITVVYNAQELIENTIKSVIDQTYNNMEYIIIDGLSTDGTVDIIKRYEDNLSYWVSEQDNGIYDAMNKAVSIAAGDWLLFLNAGDTLTENTIVSDASRYFENKYDFIYGDRYRIGENKASVYEKAGPVEGTLYKEVVFHQSLFTRAGLLKENPYNLTYRLAADFEYVVKSWVDKKSFLHIPLSISNFLEGGASRVNYLLAQTEASHILMRFQPDKAKWRNNFYFKALLLSNLGFIINFMLQRFLRRYPDFKVHLSFNYKRNIVFSSNVVETEVEDFFKKINGAFSSVSIYKPSVMHVIRRFIVNVKKVPIKLARLCVNKYKNLFAKKQNIDANYINVECDSTWQNIEKRLNEEGVSFSVITVVYNDAELLEKTIKSVIGQSYQNVEYIIVDGGSTDGTLEVIRKYEDYITKWMSEKDDGIYDAMNKGVDLANGDWLNFMNAGDVFSDNDTLVKVLKHICADKDVVYGDRYYIQEGNKTLQKAKDINTIFQRMPFGHQSAFVRKDIIKKYKFNGTYKFAADYNLLLNLYLSGHQFEYMGFPVCDFLSGGESESGLRPYLEVIKILLDNTKDPVVIQKNDYVRAFRKHAHSLIDECLIIK